jgi:hypothetical protein
MENRRRITPTSARISHARDEEDQDQRESDPLKEEDHHQREPQDDDQVG